MKEEKKKVRKLAKRTDEIEDRLGRGLVERPANPSMRPKPFKLDTESGMGIPCDACERQMEFGSMVVAFAGETGKPYEVHEECYEILARS
jgi:hypothetical protein